MNKIVGIIHPFDICQTFYVYQGGDKIQTLQIRMKDVPDEVLNLSHIYNINQIDLSGSKQFIDGLIRQVHEKENLRYNKNNLVINCI